MVHCFAVCNIVELIRVYVCPRRFPYPAAVYRTNGEPPLHRAVRRPADCFLGCQWTAVSSGAADSCLFLVRLGSPPPPGGAVAGCPASRLALGRRP